MTRSREVGAPGIIAVEIAGHLDLRTLQAWAVEMASDAGAEMGRRMGTGAGMLKCAASVVAGSEQWQHSPDAIWLSVQWGAVSGCIAIPMPLAVSVVTRALGYDGHSQLPPGPLDLQVLMSCLQPAVTWLQDKAGLPGPSRLEAGDASDGNPGEGALVLLSFSVDTGTVSGTWQLAVPWDALREAIRAAQVAGGTRRRIGLDALRCVPVRAEVVIEAGQLAVTESMKLEKGDVITLDRDLTGLVELRVAGRNLGRGRLGSSGGMWALRVREVHWPTAGSGAEEVRHE